MLLHERFEALTDCVIDLRVERFIKEQITKCVPEDEIVEYIKDNIDLRKTNLRVYGRFTKDRKAVFRTERFGLSPLSYTEKITKSLEPKEKQREESLIIYHGGSFYADIYSEFRNEEEERQFLLRVEDLFGFAMKESNGRPIKKYDMRLW